MEENNFSEEELNEPLNKDDYSKDYSEDSLFKKIKKSFSKIQQEFFHELREYQRKEIVQNRDHDDELEL